jgi:hypothetical protein
MLSFCSQLFLRDAPLAIDILLDEPVHLLPQVQALLLRKELFAFYRHKMSSLAIIYHHH